MAATVFCIRVVLTKEILSIVIKCIKQQFYGFYVLLEMKFTIYGTQIHANILLFSNPQFLFDSF